VTSRNIASSEASGGKHLRRGGRKMVKFEVSIDIDCPPDIVVQALMKAENATYWTTDLEEFEVVKGKPGEVGAIGRLHYVQKGHEYIMEDVLEYSDPGKRYVSRVSGPAITARVETNIVPINSGTKLAIVWTGTGKKLILRLLLPLLQKKITRQSQKELATFKNLIETRGPDFSRASEQMVDGFSIAGQ
jgi:hypothetical protein